MFRLMLRIKGSAANLMTEMIGGCRLCVMQFSWLCCNGFEV
ncbi:hypothetical protein Hdeb2414_s0001g00022731 [Helianthus debilis subsp. tardiflorus]